MSSLSNDERDVLKTILRFHAVSDENLEARLTEFATWIRDIEHAKLNRSGHQPHFPLVFLSLMGIHGKSALAKKPTA